MRKKTKYIILSVAFLLSVNFIFNKISYATNETSENSLSYSTILPENQKNKNVGYFDLAMKPNMQQKVLINLSNSSNKAMKVRIGFNTAKTNSNGVIEYGSSQELLSKDVNSKFTEIVTGKSEISIPPKTNVDYEVNIKMPAEQYDGVISGGIYIEELSQNESNKESIKNKYVYLIGMLLTETNSEVKPNLEFNKIYLSDDVHQNSIIFNYSNTASAYVDSMSVDIKIRKKDKKDIILQLKNDGMRMAPNSDIKLPISLGDKKVEPGVYQASILIKTNNKDNWNWKQNFEITENYIKERNKIIPDKVMYNNKYTYLLMIIVFILISFFLYINKTNIFFSNKKRKQLKKRNK